MEERKTHIGLLLSILFTLSLLELAVYQEQSYLRTNDLGLVAPPFRHMVHLSLIFIHLFFIACIFTISPFSKCNFISSLVFLSCLGVFQIFLMIYGFGMIPLSIKHYQKAWVKTGNNTAVAAAEHAMKCCGYNDILLAISYNCPYARRCSDMIETAKSPRQMQFSLLIICSLLFELFSFYAVIDLHKSPPSQTHTEFDELLASTE